MLCTYIEVHGWRDHPYCSLNSHLIQSVVMNTCHGKSDLNI